jgi:hypothetical protein
MTARPGSLNEPGSAALHPPAGGGVRHHASSRLPGAKPGTGMQSGDVPGQLLPGNCQPVPAKCRQTVEDEGGAGGGTGDAGAYALPPVPAPAGHSGVIAPPNLSGLGMAGGRWPVTDGAEWLVPARSHQPGRPDAGGAFPR